MLFLNAYQSLTNIHFRDQSSSEIVEEDALPLPQNGM